MSPQKHRFEKRDSHDWVIDVEDTVTNQVCLTRKSEIPRESHSGVNLTSLTLPRAAVQRSDRLTPYKVICLKCQTATTKEPFRFSGQLKRIKAALANLKALAIISFVLNVVLLWPTFASTQDGRLGLKYTEWQSVKDYRDYCKNEPNDKSAECQRARTMTLSPPPAYHQSSSLMIPVSISAASPLEIATNSPTPVINPSTIPISNIGSRRPELDFARPVLRMPIKTKPQLTTVTGPATPTAAYPGHGPTLHQPQATGIPTVKNF